MYRGDGKGIGSPNEFLSLRVADCVRIKMEDYDLQCRNLREAAEHLKAIREAHRDETLNKFVSKATRALQFAFQQRQVLSPHDASLVDKATADTPNEQLRQLVTSGRQHDTGGGGPRASIRHRRTST